MSELKTCLEETDYAPFL